MKRKFLVVGLLSLLTIINVSCESDSEISKTENNAKTIPLQSKTLDVSALKLNGKNLVEVNDNGRIERTEKFILSANEYLVNQGKGVLYVNTADNESKAAKLGWYWFADNSEYLGDGTAEQECGNHVYTAPMFMVDPENKERIFFITLTGIVLHFNTITIKGAVNNGECWELNDPVKTVRRILTP
ncbi:hypothetical protein ACM46_11860 [Chryseobacterium angstadtii]|uniref:Uncharacterized protein n=1 Tax=Chryseobacterium angstadtii TaxID=558151 RepID=A0A0J7IFV8_9FLAO|nr:hypothetical protein [Chryseobacterium angstadtii]KMQ64899.1 hypothetical protein ACM46_11860 [Chryseobacterium angstadtii]